MITIIIIHSCTTEVIKVTPVSFTLTVGGLKDQMRQWIFEGHSLIHSANIF